AKLGILLDEALGECLMRNVDRAAENERDRKACSPANHACLPFAARLSRVGFPVGDPLTGIRTRYGAGWRRDWSYITIVGGSLPGAQFATLPEPGGRASVPDPQAGRRSSGRRRCRRRAG